MMNNTGQTAFTGIIGAIAGAAVAGVIGYYIAFVLMNSLYVTINSSVNVKDFPGTGVIGAIPAEWLLVLTLIPLVVAAIIAAIIIKVFES